LTPQPKSITGPIRVERNDDDDGNITYEVWDHGPKTYHMICSISEVHCDNAKAEADFVALALGNAIGALMVIERTMMPITSGAKGGCACTSIDRSHCREPDCGFANSSGIRNAQNED
jgi:hypothetical protein